MGTELGVGVGLDEGNSLSIFWNLLFCSFNL
jgi:hypothetical protein